MNEHHGIIGARNLTQAEIDLMNEIKAKGAELQALVEKVAANIMNTGQLPHEAGSHALSPHRWLAIGQTHFQEGLMALTRAVARPSSF